MPGTALGTASRICCRCRSKGHLRDAVVDELISSNPFVLKRGELSKKIDKNPEWRQKALFTREEVEY